MKKQKSTRNPVTKGLPRDIARWYESVDATYALEDHHRRLLLMACESLARYRKAQATVDAEGQVVPDRFGQPKCHPAVINARDEWIGFCRCLRELGLDDSAPPEVRIPRLHGRSA